MAIQSVNIEKYRGIREGRIEDLAPLTILTGPNGCGKSTVLEAIHVAASPTGLDALALALTGRPRISDGLKWLAYKGMSGQKTDLAVVARDGSIYRRTLDRGPGWVALREGERVLGTIQSQGPSVTNTMKQGVPSASLPVVGLDLDESIPLARLFTHAVLEDRKQSVLALLAPVIEGFRDLEVLQDDNDQPVLFMTLHTGRVPVACTGSGTHAMVRLVLQMARLGEGTALLEEPEVHLHPRAIQQAARAILTGVRRNVQVILATHSLEVIDALLAEATDTDLTQMACYRCRLVDGVLGTGRIQGPAMARLRKDIEDDLR